MRITIDMSDDLIKKVADLIDSYDDPELIRYRHDLLLARINQKNHEFLPNSEGIIISRYNMGGGVNTIEDLILAGKKIQVVKIVRMKTGLGLKEAKEFVDKYFIIDSDGNPYGTWVDFVK